MAKTTNVNNSRQLKITMGLRTIRDTYSTTRYISEVASLSRPMSEDKEKECFNEYLRTGDEKALDDVIVSNLRFVISVAKLYEGRGASLDDLIAEGNMALIEAAKKFNPEMGVRFITYAVWYIKRAMTTSLAEYSHTYRLPMNRNALLFKVNDTIKNFLQKEYREPTPDELAEILGEDVDEIKIVLTFNNRATSIQEKLSDSDDADTMETFLAETNEKLSPDRFVEKESFVKDMNVILEHLSPREEFVIRRAFGIGCQIQTDNDIAASLHATKERVRQIRQGALNKLREDESVEKLISYLGK